MHQVNIGQLQEPFSSNFEVCFIPELYLMRSHIAKSTMYLRESARSCGQSFTHQHQLRKPHKSCAYFSLNNDVQCKPNCDPFLLKSTYASIPCTHIHAHTHTHTHTHNPEDFWLTDAINLSHSSNMPHLPVVLRRAAKLSVVLILLGVAEYVIIANIHTNLGDHHTRREAAKIAQSLSQGFYDWDQDRDFRVVGYSWQAREAERQKKPNGKQDSVSRIGRAAKDLPLSVPSDATTPKRERQTTDHRNAPKHRDKSFISNDARQESVLDTQDKAMRPGQSDRIRPQAKRQHQSTVNPFTDTGTVQTPSRDFSVSTDFIAKRDPALSQNRGGIWKKVLPPSSSKREHKETFREGITDVRGDKKAHQIFNEVPKESESEAEYLNRLLLSYMMESKHRNRAEIPQSDSNRETELVVDYDNLQIIQTDRGLKVVDKRLALGPEVLVENSSRPYRNLSQSEMKGSDIMFTLRTTTSYHRNRLPLLMETWMSQVDCSHIFLVTDGADPEMERKSKAMGICMYTLTCTHQLAVGVSGICMHGCMSA